MATLVKGNVPLDLVVWVWVLLLKEWDSCFSDICPTGLSAQDDLTFLRVRSKKHEIMVAPGTHLLLYLVY